MPTPWAYSFKEEETLTFDNPVRSALHIVKFVYTLVLCFVVVPILVGVSLWAAYAHFSARRVEANTVPQLCTTSDGNPFGTWQKANLSDLLPQQLSPLEALEAQQEILVCRKN